MRVKNLIAAVVMGALAVVAVPSSAFAATQAVQESDVARQAEDSAPTKDWVIYTRPTAPGTAEFKTGPAAPPLGSGSLELKTTSGSDKVYAYNFSLAGKKLANAMNMAYSTYRTAGSAQQVAALNLQVDINGSETGGFTTLVFEPVYNTDQGAVENDKWQTWDADMDGQAIWWSSNPIPGAPNRDTFVSLESIKAQNPDAVIGGYGINQGTGNEGLTTAVDKLSINKTTYDFEVTLPKSATSKDQCKDGGYKNFETEYKNQGDCVSAVASDGKAKGNPVKQESPFESFLRSIGL